MVVAYGLSFAALILVKVMAERLNLASKTIGVLRR
jgi:hypothetical protein